MGKKKQLLLTIHVKNIASIFTFSLLCQHCRTGSIEAGAFRLGVPQRSILESLCSQWQDEIGWVRKIELRVFEHFQLFAICGFKATCENITCSCRSRNIEHGKDMSLRCNTLSKVNHSYWQMVGWNSLTNHWVPTCLFQTYFQFHRFREGRHEYIITSKQFVRKTNNFPLLVFDALKMWTLESTEKQKVQKPQRESKTTQIRSLNKWFSPKCVHRQLLQNPYKSPYK